MITEIYLRNNMYTLELEAQCEEEDELIRLFFQSPGEITEQFHVSRKNGHLSLTLTKER